MAEVEIIGKAIKNVRKWDVDIFADDKETDEEYFEKMIDAHAPKRSEK